MRIRSFWSKLREVYWGANAVGGISTVSGIEDIGEIINTFRQNNDAPISSTLSASKKLRESCIDIQRSWSGSCLGWHSNMYFRDFEAPSVYERFSCDRGGTDGIPEGWEEKQPEEVKSRIEKLVGNSFSIDDFEVSVSELKSEAQNLRDEVLITFSSIRVESLQNGEQKLLSELKNLSLGTGRYVFIKQQIPSGVVTSDIEAVSEGIRMPAGLYWEGVALEGISLCESIETFIRLTDRLARQIHAKETSKPEVSDLHPAIVEKCFKLYSDGHYPEAAEKGFKVVKDRLRELTTHEKGSDAFGSGLYINGASAPNVDEDFNKGVQFLTMAIDRFRK